MKGHGNGAEDVGQESSKNREQEIKGPAVARDLFWRRRQHSPACSCLLLDLTLAPYLQRGRGWEVGERSFLSWVLTAF